MADKDKRKTENRLIEAVSEIIEEYGFAKIGINHIARIAGCDKVLIYRYTRQYPLFNGVDFSKEESWIQFEKVIANYIDMLFDTLKL